MWVAQPVQAVAMVATLEIEGLNAMDAGAVTRSPATALPAPTREDAVQVRLATRTELPPEKVVTAPNDSAPVLTSRDALRAATDRAAIAVAVDRQLTREVEKKVVQDASTGAVVFRSVDTSTGRVINQYPDDAMLRAIAYGRAQTQAMLSEEEQKPALATV